MLITPGTIVGNGVVFTPYVPFINGFTAPAYSTSMTTNDATYGLAVNSSGRFVTVGAWWSNSTASTSTSTNGSTWTTPATMGTATKADLRAITVNSSGQFVAVGYAGSLPNQYPAYSTSTDGLTWTTPAAMNGYTSAVIRMTQVTWSSALNLFVAIGYKLNGSYYQPYSAYSSDGSTWTTPAVMGGVSGTTGYYSGLTVNNAGKFVAVGVDPSARGIYSTSTDGINWTTPSFMNNYQGLAHMNQVAWSQSSGLFVAVGGTESNSFASVPVYATSGDGTTWTTPTTIAGTTASWCSLTNIVADKSGLLVAIGALGENGQSGSPPCFTQSGNGTTWTIPALFSNYNPNNAWPMSGITSYNGLFVTTGSLGFSPLPAYSTSF
jgi:hypothetical protein